MEEKMTGRLEMHADTRILLSHLREVFVKEKKDFVPYAELSAAIGGRNVQKEARGLMDTARKRILTYDHILTEAVSGEGLQRVKETAEYLDGVLGHFRRVSRHKSRAVITVMDGNDMNNDQRVRTFARLAAVGTVEMISRPKAVKKLEAGIDAQNPKELPAATSFEALKAQFEK